jgi:transcriptional regulator with XRE-family HTH domain
MAKEKIELGATGQTVAKNLRRLRTDRELSLKELAEKAAASGRKFGINALSQAEKGQRRLDVDDLVALAAALDVTPAALMLPVTIDREAPVQITGVKEPVPAQRAWRWMVGDQPLPGQMEGRSAEWGVQIFQSIARPWWLMGMLSADVVEYEGFRQVRGEAAKEIFERRRPDPEDPSKTLPPAFGRMKPKQSPTDQPEETDE